MSPAAPHPSARTLTDRQLALLDRLADIGMEIAEAAGRMARDQAGGAAVPAADPGLTFSRAARAVRLTIALQQRLTEGLAALEAGRAKARAAAAARVRDRAHRRIERAAEAEAPDAVEVERLSSCAWERLAETEDDDLLDLPFDELVVRICRDLGLAPREFIMEGVGQEPFRFDGGKPEAGGAAPGSPFDGGAGALIPGPSPLEGDGSRSHDRQRLRRC